MRKDGTPEMEGQVFTEYYLVAQIGAYVEKVIKGKEGPVYAFWKKQYEKPTRSKYSHNFMYGIDTLVGNRNHITSDFIPQFIMYGSGHINNSPEYMQFIKNAALKDLKFFQTKFPE